MRSLLPGDTWIVFPAWTAADVSLLPSPEAMVAPARATMAAPDTALIFMTCPLAYSVSGQVALFGRVTIAEEGSSTSAPAGRSTLASVRTHAWPSGRVTAVFMGSSQSAAPVGSTITLDSRLARASVEPLGSLTWLAPSGSRTCTGSGCVRSEDRRVTIAPAGRVAAVWPASSIVPPRGIWVLHSSSTWSS